VTRPLQPRWSQWITQVTNEHMYSQKNKKELSLTFLSLTTAGVLSVSPQCQQHSNFSDLLTSDKYRLVKGTANVVEGTLAN